MKKICLSALIAMSIVASNISAETIDLKLDSLISESIKRNSNIIFDRIKSEIINNQVEYEKDIFTPQVYSNISRIKSDVPNNTQELLSRGNLETYSEDSTNIEAGIRGVLPTGGSWQTALKTKQESNSLINEYKTYDSEYTNSLEISFTQHLLRGFGKDITLAKYHLTKAEQDIFKKEYEKKILDLMASVIQVYWKMYGLHELKKNYIQSISLNEKSVQVLEDRFKRGDVPKSELLEAKTSLMSKKADLNRVENDINNSRSNLLDLLNVSEEKNKNITFRLVDKPNAYKMEKLTVDEYFKKAIDNWPEYKIAQYKLKKEELNLKYAKDNIRPQLDLLVSLSNNTLDDSQKYDFADDEYVSWNLGLEFSMPIFDRQNKNALNIAKLKKYQALKELETLNSRLFNAISAKYNSFNNAKQQVALYEEGLVFREELLRSERIGFELGNRSIKDIITQENDLITHKRKLFSSIIDWKLSEASLQKAIGELMGIYVDIEKVKNYKNNEHASTLSNIDFGKL